MTKTNKAKELKRRFRISLPVIFAAFIPAKELKRFNQFLQKGSSAGHTGPYRLVKKEEEARELEILVHTSDSNLFGAIGHVDICYQGKVISYGSYDPFQSVYLGRLGMAYCLKWIRNHTSNYVKKESQKTLFGYSLSLTEEENQVEKRLAEIDQLLEPLGST